MTRDFDETVVQRIRALYKKDDLARKLFDQNATRERDASATSIDRLTYLLNASRSDVRALTKRLQDAQCGVFVLGRRGQKSRFAWSYSCISLGKTAAGQTSKLEEAADPISEDEEVEAGARPATMTIAQAKTILSQSLGVPESAIEILVRA